MKNTFAFSLIATLLIMTTWVTASEDLSRELTENIVRLHILANSDTAEDQNLKLMVRDRLLTESKQTKTMLTDNEILAICQDEIKKNGYPYAVSIERGYFYFPKKSYDNLTLPAGKYNAVRILIGKGNGQNWWCVMYPPLCFTGESIDKADKTALKQLESTLSPEAFAVICESNHITIKPSFKLLELWQTLKAQWQT